MKTNKVAKRLLMLLSAGCVIILGSCGGSDSSTASGGGSGNSGGGSSTEAWYIQYRGNEVSNGQSLTAYVNEQTAMLVAYDIDGSEISDVTYSSDNESVLSIDTTTGYITANAEGTATVTAYNANDSQSFNFTVMGTEAANGAYSFATASYDEKAEILGVLEKYAVDNYLTGLTIFSNGGYVCYNSDRYTPIPTNYVSGYGWGTRKEGVLSSDLDNARGGRPSYYQICTTSIPQHANAMDASGSDVSDFADYFTTSYYATRLNATNDGYEWYPSLATDERPLAVDDNGNVIDSDLNSRWRIHLRTGENAPVYRTASTQTYNGVDISDYDGQQVQLEDYLTPFKFMLTNYNGQYRGSEMTDGTSGFVGAANYYNATTTNPGTGAVWNDTLWDTYMGSSETGLLPDGSRGNLITGHDDQGDYIEFNLLYPCTQFYAMYYLTSSLYSPLPQSFVELWGTKLGKKPTGYTPVDTMLSTGAYYIDEYSTQKLTVTRNDDFYEYKAGQAGTFILNDGVTSRKVYQIDGFQYNYVSESALAETAFTSGEVDSYSPTVATLNSTYNTTSGSTGSINWRRYQTEGDSNFKLNINSSTQEEWDSRFGTNGSVTPHASNEQWECKGYMSNEHFLNFLSFSLDRQTICESRGTIPTQDYFSDTYLIDPENGVSYNSTDAHKAVLADRYNSTYGYNVTAAKNELLQAFTDDGGIIDMTNNGELDTEKSGSGAGTADNPYLITIDMYWMNPTDETDYGDVFDSIENVFASFCSEYGYEGYKLNIVQHAGTSDYNEVYDRMKEGLFDMGFGAISGGALNPLNFFEVLKSDNSSGFTLNWGPDTSKVSDDIVYDGKTWSFDGLWQASDTVAAINNGEIANVENVSTSGNGSVSYQSIDSTAKSVTYRLSFDTLIQGGADKSSLVVSITNGSVSATYATVTDEDAGELYLELDSSNRADIVLTSDFNTLEEEDDEGNVTSTDCSIVTLKVTYDLTIDGAVQSTSSSTTLSTYYGITGEN